MKKKIVAVAIAAFATVGFSATASAGGFPNSGQAPNGANHASVASTLGGPTVAGIMPCHVTSAAPQCD